MDIMVPTERNKTYPQLPILECVQSLVSETQPRHGSKRQGFSLDQPQQDGFWQGCKICRKAQSRQYPDFAILKDEVKIVKPDVVVFLIGNDYNAQMQQYLNVSLELEDPDLHIYQVIDPEGILPTHSYKIYHPR